MTDSELLSQDNLAVLFAKFDGCEGDVLYYLRAHCSETANGDIQGAVEGYEATHMIPGFRHLSDEQLEEEQVFADALREPNKAVARRFVDEHTGKPMSDLEHARYNGYLKRLAYK